MRNLHPALDKWMLEFVYGRVRARPGTYLSPQTHFSKLWIQSLENCVLLQQWLGQ
jgi:hypothetical protein